MKHVPDLEQIIQERGEALQSATAINSPSTISEMGTDASQPNSEDLATPDWLSEVDSTARPGVTLRTADELF
ncbi:hypothetical protein NDU88_003523 [Pleurodeles waltl]|uniref:Uncharacterized protein n=1 Tax=Pleurodeles waltl TaxID=8319 RepID=A0AAV7M4A1_PLEWA|nr:hypothetical protein NDU88_003523 [Pleurodeles waltl]